MLFCTGFFLCWVMLFVSSPYRLISRLEVCPLTHLFVFISKAQQLSQRPWAVYRAE